MDILIKQKNSIGTIIHTMTILPSGSLTTSLSKKCFKHFLYKLFVLVQPKIGNIGMGEPKPKRKLHVYVFQNDIKK